ncbi:hypothetical protein L7F22_023933 [Adiantum nelumboides]|nr:hypothetical protein [Adiantum nelumboides]
MGPQKCKVCEDANSKYKCPTCLLPYCSLPCYKRHKETPCVKAEPLAESNGSSLTHVQPPRPFEAADEQGWRLEKSQFEALVIIYYCHILDAYYTAVYLEKRQPFLPRSPPPLPLPAQLSAPTSSSPPCSPNQSPSLLQREQAAMDELSNILARVNIKFPTFKGLSTKDADDHVRRFVSLCKGRGLNREVAYLVLFPSTLDSLADKWYNQFEENHFADWGALRHQFCEAFRPGDAQEKVLDELGNLVLQPNETFTELTTRTKALVAKLPQQSGDFMVKNWVEKALPKGIHRVGVKLQ